MVLYMYLRQLKISHICNRHHGEEEQTVFLIRSCVVLSFWHLIIWMIWFAAWRFTSVFESCLLFCCPCFFVNFSIHVSYFILLELCFIFKILHLSNCLADLVSTSTFTYLYFTLVCGCSCYVIVQLVISPLPLQNLIDWFDWLIESAPTLN